MNIKFKSFVVVRLFNVFFKKYVNLTIDKEFVAFKNNKDAITIKISDIKDVYKRGNVLFYDLVFKTTNSSYAFASISSGLCQKIITLIKYLQNYDLIKQDIDLYESITNASHYVCNTEAKKAANTLKSSPLYLFKALFFDDLTLEQKKYSKLFNDIVLNPEYVVSEKNKLFIKNEITKYDDFFNSVEKNPLTERQKEAVVVDEDNSLIVAGAGSGKTSVIVAKVMYLLKKKLANPTEILLLTFNKKAQEEIQERLSEKLEFLPDIMTFHGLGNSILKLNKNEKTVLSEFATDEIKYRKFIRNKIEENIKSNPEFSDLICKYFQEFFYAMPNIMKFENIGEYYDYLENFEVRTLNGEKVRSFEECYIANYLYLNNINYEYEKPYEIDTSSEYKQYQPDFYLTDYGIYIEHFGIDKNNKTAPFIDNEKYLQQMEWKIKTHKENGTKLITTFSWEHFEGKLLTNLQKKLKQYNVKFSKLAQNEIFEKLNKQLYMDTFSELLSVFLNHFKSNQFSVEQINKRIESKLEEKETYKKENQFIKMESNRQKAFLDVFMPVYKEYQSYLKENNNNDFNDMIALATKMHSMGIYKTPYKYVLVDEFQDISSGRAKFLKELLNEDFQIKLFCVGDDWQSIYRFAGSDISIMRNFKKHFGYTKRIDLDKTFRFDNQINNVASRFITKNPNQLKKEINTYKKSESPSVIICYKYEQTKEKDIVFEVLQGISKKCAKDKNAVLLLSRFNKLRNKDIEKTKEFRNIFNFYKKSFPDLDINFSSVHGSKGLGFDYVVVLDMEKGAFPVEKIDDPILNLVLAESEDYKNAEERRLFYVALTRAKEKVYLITEIGKESDFIKELITEKDYNIATLGEIGGDKKIPCPKCKTGVMLKSKDGNYFRCSHALYCNNVVPVCDYCKDGFYLYNPETNLLECTNCKKIKYPCPLCKTGYLIKRTGKFGDFYGCSNFPECRYTKNIKK